MDLDIQPSPSPPPTPSQKSIEKMPKRPRHEASEDKDEIPIKRFRQTVIKTDDDSVPLPDPFPLPRHYRSDVEEAIVNRKMDRETTSALCTSVAAAMLVYKKYPATKEYEHVVKAIISKCSFMASPIGTPYVRTLQS